MKKRLSGNAIFFYTILSLIFIGSIYLAEGLLPNIPLESLSDPLTAPTTIENATENGGFYNLNDSQIKNNNPQQLQLVPVEGNPIITSCSQTLGVIFLIDTSNIMSSGTKLQGVQAGLRAFAADLPDPDILTFVTFGDDATQLIPPSAYSLVKSNFLGIASNLQPYTDGENATAKAFTFANDYVLQQELPQIAGSKQYNLIYISGSMPETTNMDTRCSTNGTDINANMPDCIADCQTDMQTGHVRCFDPSQDATAIAQDIKNKGMTIFSIAYPESQSFFANKQATMMQAIASDGDYQTVPTNNDLTQIIGGIMKKICK